jgi:hypothetical protein
MATSNRPAVIMSLFCLVAVLAANLTPSRLQAQSEQPWGAAVNGVQLRLVLAKGTSAPASGAPSTFLPALEAQLRNTGTEVVTFSPDGLVEGALEVDGIVESHIIFRQSSSGRFELQPGAVSPVFPVYPRQWLVMRPPITRVIGRHSVRLRSVVTDPDVAVRDASGRSLALTSNEIDITVQP